MAIWGPPTKGGPVVNGGQDRVVIKCPYCHDKDMGLNPTATIKENIRVKGYFLLW